VDRRGREVRTNDSDTLKGRANGKKEKSLAGADSRDLHIRTIAFFLRSVYLYIVKKEAARSSETLVLTYQTVVVCHQIACLVFILSAVEPKISQIRLRMR
jgi:hypothetical protein